MFFGHNESGSCSVDTNRRSISVFPAGIYDGSPPQGLGTARRGKMFLQKSHKIKILSILLNRRGGAPSGAAAPIIIGGMGASAPIIDLIKKYLRALAKEGGPSQNKKKE